MEAQESLKGRSVDLREFKGFDDFLGTLFEELEEEAT